MPADPGSSPQPGSGRRCAVLGSPIAHSLSPTLHRAAYTALGLDWSYDAYDVQPAALDGFVRGLTPEWRGLSLTMPLKQAAVGCCQEVEDQARRLASVNTIVIAADRTKVGYNTDVPGFVAAFADVGRSTFDTAAVVGSGATARSAVAALSQLGVAHVDVIARSIERARVVGDVARAAGMSAALHDLADPAAVSPADVMVSTIPVDGQRRCAEVLARLAPVTFDVVYDPPDTPLLRDASARGNLVIGGIELLLQQAGRQVELMTGAPAPLDAMRTAGLGVLAERRATSDLNTASSLRDPA